MLGRAALAAQADGFVAALPDGLDTRLGERGTTLSGGQRQRLALARALVRRPRLLVLDDATTAVDPEVEARILAALRTASGRTRRVVVVAYRQATIALADEVVYLEDGHVVDRGTHAELLVRNPGYADLVNAYEQEPSRAEVSVREQPYPVDGLDTGESISAMATLRRGMRALARAHRTASAARSPSRCSRRSAASSCPSRCSRPSTRACAPGGPDVRFTTIVAVIAAVVVVDHRRSRRTG